MDDLFGVGRVNHNSTVQQMRRLATIENEDILEQDDLSVTFKAKAADDGDGAPSSHGDACYQPYTSLRFHGKSINADTVPYVVVPPVIARLVKGVVLGCRALIKNTLNGKSCIAVVADIGPEKKLGEISTEAERRLGLPASPVSGGTSAHIVEYTLWPGVPAVVDGVTYDLQPYR